MNKLRLLLLILIIASAASSCKKDSFITGGEAILNTSDDSLHFDTLFTTKGSVTKYFKVYNKNDQKLKIGNISLSGGDNSYFNINVDGFSGPAVTNIEMAANDSLYVFVTAKIDPTAANLPFIVEDSVQINYNGNQKWVQLQAWGQNANFLSSARITNNTTWTNAKPYVITGGLLIDENVTLTIQKGARIYLHADAPLVVDGTISAIGEKYDSTKIVFNGDRLDDPYRDYPASWPGIYFRDKSKGNDLKYVVVENAYQGIVVQNPSADGNPKLKLDACIINNCYDAGIMGIASEITAVNCLISNCGKNIVIANGGDYNFSQCTDVAYSNTFIAHKQPVLGLTNFLKLASNVAVNDLNASFTNCIFWGDNGVVTDEVATVKENSAAFNVSFTNCLWKITGQPEGISSTGMIENADPTFLTIDTRKDIYDFHLKETSPAVNAGAIIGVLTDIEGNPRDPNFPDIGAYESAF